MTFNVDLNRKAIERDMKMAAVVASGVVAVKIAAGVVSSVRDARQAREIRRLRKQVQALEERLAILEDAQKSE
ncbi:MAG: LapA family protein [Firmicutes bacterium]|nr:LapA family protein [Bacillota bacterium]